MIEYEFFPILFFLVIVSFRFDLNYGRVYSCLGRLSLERYGEGEKKYNLYGC